MGLGVVISQIGDNYYWASRENTPLVAIDAGAFVTYFAVNGRGYVRVIKPELKSAASLLDAADVHPPQGQPPRTFCPVTPRSTESLRSQRVSLDCTQTPP